MGPKTPNIETTDSGRLAISRDAELLRQVSPDLSDARLRRAFKWVMFSQSRKERELACLYLYGGLPINAIALKLDITPARATEIRDALAAREVIVFELQKKIERMERVDKNLKKKGRRR